jgi:hypothetical protein
MPAIQQALYELQERAGKMLGSQTAFISAPEEQSILAGGFASGKTHICCTKGLILSSIFPGNRGLVGRYHSTDLEDSTIPVFFDVCPPSWIRSYNKQSKRLVFKNSSEVIFRHLHDASAQTKSRRIGANLGWAFIDQLEECEIGHWNTMLGRLRLPAAKKKYLFGAMNPAGHDDFYKLFFEGIDEDLRSLPNGTFHRVIRKANRLGIVVNSNENRRSNGGFVDDGYFDEMISSYPQDWLDRYIYCSFDDFAGKIYRAYNLTSVHNIKPFTYPKHWNAIIGIDVGGDAPWAVLDERIDEFGNMITVNEFYKPSVNVAEVAGWIKANTPWSDPNTQFIIDYENKLAMLELAEHGIHCRPAVKKVKPGILRTGGYYTIQKGLGLPSWYRETQPGERYEKFKDAGSPRAFITENCANHRREMDNYLWDKDDKPKKVNDHSCDADRYIKFSRPIASKLPAHDKYAKLRAVDLSSAKEWEAFDKRMQARVDKRNGAGAMTELSFEEVPINTPTRMTQEYEWGD